MSYKISKYMYKINNTDRDDKKITYVRKISKYMCPLITEKQTGGEIIEFVRDPHNDTNPANLDSLLQFIKKTIETKTKHGVKKYCVILIGTPASGKSLAKKVSCDIIKQIEKSDVYHDDIYNSFVDINVDDYVYGKKIEPDGLTGKQELYELSQDFFRDKGIISDIDKKIYMENEKNQAEIEKFVGTATAKYFSIRNDINSIGSLMMFVASYFSLNLFIETVGDRSEYLDWLINNFCPYENYTPILVYPKVSNAELHKQRLISRAIKEGRFVSFDYIQSIIPNIDRVYDYLNSYSFINKLVPKVFVSMKFENNETLNKSDESSYNFRSLNVLDYHEYAK